MDAGLRVWLWLFVYNWIIGGDIIMKVFYQSRNFVCVNKSGRKLYDASNIEGIEFRLFEKGAKNREIYKRFDGNKYKFYTAMND